MRHYTANQPEQVDCFEVYGNILVTGEQGHQNPGERLH